MKQKVRSIRPFVGAKDYPISRSFYKDLGFEEKVISDNMSLFQMEDTSFYLQEYYVKDWVDNTMVLMEMDDIDSWWQTLQELQLDKKYPGVRLIPVKQNDWGKECMVIDPSGVLWHFATFSS